VGLKAHVIAFIEFSVGLEVSVLAMLFIIIIKEAFMKNKIGEKVKKTILSSVGLGVALLPR
jgi:hypothetical protein